MKTVLIIENAALELETLVKLFDQWQKKVKILTAPEEKSAIIIMSRRQVDLVVCDLALPESATLEDFSLLTHTFPYIPCIALAKEKGPVQKEVLRRGASHCLTKPLDSSKLLLHSAELLDTGTSGNIKGIPIYSFLQMLEAEEKTCTLQVNKKDEKGLLYIKNGALIGAESKNFTGEKAAHLILSWQETVLEILFFNGQRKRQINMPLISIIMEAFHLKNERDKQNKQKNLVKKHQLPLKHLSTRGKRIPLEIGYRVKLEFPHLDTLFESTIVGMLQENYLIIATPQPLSDREDLVGGQQRVMVKYVYKGRVWMFKSQLMKAIESPSQLLFFEYPGVIHYHELRNAKRTSIFIPSTFHLRNEPELYGALIDLSMTGCLSQIKHKGENLLPLISINTTVMLRCLLPGIKEEQKINGRVRNMKIDHNETRIGIEFENLQPHLADTIGKYLYSLEGLND
jgi:CheY-like chemotaxis protein/c-di-GMP-binding flagellar brake protein YcgR